MRSILAWIAYPFGDLIYLVFDRWFPLGMVGPIYRLYNGSMQLSVRLQGDGPGPWIRTRL
jgi:hypothetical protein